MYLFQKLSSYEDHSRTDASNDDYKLISIGKQESTFSTPPDFHDPIAESLLCSMKTQFVC